MSIKINDQNIQKTFDEGFIKTCDMPLQNLDSQAKVQLNRRGNQMMNEGQIEQAARIFVATGYSDGLCRVGDAYYKKNQSVKALKFYLLAHNKKKSDIIIQNISGVVTTMLGM